MIGKTWETIVGIYRPPTSVKVPKSVWTYELGSLLEAVTSLPGNYFLLGDYNVDLIAPDKPPKDGRYLLDLLDIYDLHNLISSPTRITKTSITLLDLIITNNKNRVLTSGVVHVQLSDHSLVYAFLRKTAPKIRSRSKEAMQFHVRGNRIPYMTPTKAQSAAVFSDQVRLGLGYLDHCVLGSDFCSAKSRARILQTNSSLGLGFLN